MAAEKPASRKVKVAVIGGAGYAGGELVRLLLGHEGVELVFVQSRSQAGEKISRTHRDLLGVTDLQFTNDLTLIQSSGLEVLFLAMAHGEAKNFVAETAIPATTRIVDLSHDFRHQSQAKVRGVGGSERVFVYGLPELQRKEIQKAHDIANPGCFATALELALLPVAKAGLLKQASVNGITGSTGAGQGLSATSHFSFRDNNIQAYKTLKHQHLTEVLETLVTAQGGAGGKPAPRVHFVPWRGDFTRGIFVSAVLDLESNPGLDRMDVFKLYTDFYHGHPFVSVSDQPIDLKSVVNTNRVQIEVVQPSATQASAQAVAVHVVLDNLLKGAAGQAVQNMNLMLGFPEDQGLKLKGSVF